MWITFLAVTNVALAGACGYLLLSLDARVKQVEADVDNLYFDDDTTTVDEAVDHV